MKEMEGRNPVPHSTSNSGILLVPKPSDDPEDPLNWSTARKIRILVVICLAAFTGNVSALAGQLAYPHQAAVYHKTSLELSYSVSAAIAGLAAGALFFVPLGQILGRMSITLWSLLGSLACAIWSAQLTHTNDYNQFVVSRLLSGMFGSIPSAFGGGIILDVFFLHNRGRAFISYEVSVLLGATAGPTFSGFISNSHSWTLCFWWTVPLLVISALVVLFFGEETGYDRERGAFPVKIPHNYVANRVATFLPGTAIVAKSSTSKFAKRAAAPFLIGFSPATLTVGIFILVTFGWVLLSDILSPLFLQMPIKEGGYGFRAVQNGAFSFSAWFAIFTAQAVGYFINDSIPLWACKRYYNGIWKPELRLLVLPLSGILIPVGLGICGATLEYHKHYIGYAIGIFVVGAATLISIPAATNYVAESFPLYGTECTLIMTFYRLSWGVAIPFFIKPWTVQVGIGWVYGMAGFFTIAMWFPVLLLVWKGPTLRRWSLMKASVSPEDGMALFEM